MPSSRRSSPSSRDGNYCRTSRDNHKHSNEKYTETKRYSGHRSSPEIKIKQEVFSDAELEREKNDYISYSCATNAKPERIKSEPVKIKKEKHESSKKSPPHSYSRERSEHRRRSRSRSRSSRRRSHERSRDFRRRSRSHDRDRNERADRLNSRSQEDRSRDWNNFFNPNSEMSREAVVKRERNDDDRRNRLDEGNNQNHSSSNDAAAQKEEPNFGLSGKLTEERNTFRGVVIKYSEPPEARKPKKIRWRLYPFKGDESLATMYIHRQSAYLLGRERKIADIPIDHPSCSKQHAVLQYRLMPYETPDGRKGRRIKPYIIDLESANGTYVNGDRIDSRRYVELFERDVLKFGFSSREYVLLHENSKNVDHDEPDSSPE